MWWTLLALIPFFEEAWSNWQEFLKEKYVIVWFSRAQLYPIIFKFQFQI